MVFQCDVFFWLVSECLLWMNDDDWCCMQEILECLGWGLEDLDFSIVCIVVLFDEISLLMVDVMNWCIYIMLLLVMVFLFIIFLIGLFGVNFGGISGNIDFFGFVIFCMMLVVLVFGVVWWLKYSKWF